MAEIQKSELPQSRLAEACEPTKVIVCTSGTSHVVPLEVAQELEAARAAATMAVEWMEDGTVSGVRVHDYEEALEMLLGLSGFKP